MIVLENILSQQIVQRLGWTLVHFIWQAAAVALLLAILLRVLRKSTANLHYIFACLALALIVLLPLITIQLIPVSVSHSPAHIEPVPVPTVLPAEATEEVSMAETPVLERPVPFGAVGTASTISWKQHSTELLEPALPYVVLGWLAGVFGLSLWHLGGWAQSQRLRRKMVTQVDDTLHSKLKQLAKRLKVNRAVKLMESALVQIPTVVGWLRPVILLPASALTGLSTQQLDAILAHELAHIKRLDYLVNMLQTVVEIVGFYHPAVWWVSHKIRAERENCCDDLAVSVSGDRVSYARALTLMEEIRQSHAQLVVAASGGNLFARIRRLVGKESTANSRVSWIPSVIAILLIVTIAIPTTLALTARAETRAAAQRRDKSTKSLHEAAAAGNINRVKTLISKGVDVNAKDEKGNTPLHLVAGYGYKQKDMVELLIARGADVNAKNRDGWIPLHFTAWRSYTGHRDIAELLITSGSDIQARDKHRRTPLHYAAGSGSTDVVELLLAKGADLNARGWQGYTALHEAASWCKKDVVELLLAKGADVNAKNRMRETPLHTVAIMGWPGKKPSIRGQTVELLVANGSDVNAKDADGRTPLHHAAWDGDYNGVEILVTKGADLNAKANGGTTPLHYAAYKARKRIVELLIAKGANINAKTYAGDTAASVALQANRQEVLDLLTAKGGDIRPTHSLYIAARKGNLAEAKSFLEKGADVNAKDWLGWTALHYAARGGNKDMVQLLITKGAKVNASNKDGLMPLHQATDQDCVEILIANEADVDAKDNDGWAPLHHAARRGHEDLAELLISGGADVNPTNECRKPLHWAVMRGHTSIVKLLIEKGADVNAEDCYSDVPLHYAMWSKRKEAAELLLDNGANPNARDMSSFAPLHYAPNKDIAELLISKGADINLNNGWGGTALSGAKKKGRTEIVELLRRHGAKK